MRSGRKCVPVPTKPEEVTFRHGQNPSLRPPGPPRYGESDLAFPDNQIWVETPPEAFEDETDRTAADYNVVSVGEPPSYVREMSESQSSASMVAFPLRIANPCSHPQLDLYASSPNALLSPEDLSARQKLSNFNEAFLLRRFRGTLGPLLDVCDHERRFSVEVVERAPSCPLLLYACLAIAARHLSHSTNSVPPNAADEYHERCIAILLPGLESRDFQQNIETLLAATVILRLFEQISSHNPSNDQQRHLLAGSVYIGSQIDCATSGGLAEAAFWVFVMQDIQFALAYRKPLRLTLSPFAGKLRQKWAHNMYEMDRDWTHRAIWLLAETINYCYARNTPLPMDTMDGKDLKMKIREWETERPESFRALHVSPPNPAIGRAFPVVWFTNASHAMAVQHICMAKVLIQEYELQTMGPSAEGRANGNDNLIENLNLLFGIALSTDDEPSLRILACHALWACATWIHDPLSRSSLLDLLRRTEAENSWPWGFLVQKLVRDWRVPVRP
ncbi:hypothetical protein HFD88_003151 [Aspergillus terreus]|nr:hypothetical protein HFD88_003151 [Aspergillus terreus]